MSSQLERLEKRAEEIKLEREKPKIPTGTLEFCHEILRFQPFQYQEKLLADDKHFIVVRWCRQSGKSRTIAAKTREEIQKVLLG